MADPLKTVIAADEAKAKSYIAANKKPLLIGAAAMLVVVAAVKVFLALI